jgi:hypothetical protein
METTAYPIVPCLAERIARDHKKATVWLMPYNSPSLVKTHQSGESGGEGKVELL